MKTNARDTARNRAVMSQVRAAIRTVRKAEKPAEGVSLVSRASSILDRAVSKGILKKGTANRQKARLARSVAAR
jgi:small subunit ribosomal protein S20